MEVSVEESTGEGGEDSIFRGEKVVDSVERKTSGGLVDELLILVSKAEEGEEESRHCRVRDESAMRKSMSDRRRRTDGPGQYHWRLVVAICRRDWKRYW